MSPLAREAEVHAWSRQPWSVGSRFTSFLDERGVTVELPTPSAVVCYLDATVGSAVLKTRGQEFVKPGFLAVAS